MSGHVVTIATTASGHERPFTVTTTNGRWMLNAERRRQVMDHVRWLRTFSPSGEHPEFRIETTPDGFYCVGEEELTPWKEASR